MMVYMSLYPTKLLEIEQWKSLLPMDDEVGIFIDSLVA